MNRIRNFFSLLNIASLYLDLIIFSFAKKNYIPAERMCTLPTLCGIGAGLLLANLNFNGIEKEFADPLIWRIAFSVAGINAFFHFHRIWKMPTAIWKTAYFLYCWAISLTAFFIWVILISLAILLAVIIFVLLALGCAITSPSSSKIYYGNEAYHNGEKVCETSPGTNVFIGTKTNTVYYRTENGNFVPKK